MILNEATRRQITAADPRASTWLSANAGSGKTRVLTDRVARLLYMGVSPQNVLCLTYTKAAAAEMQNRLFQRLGGWAMLDDDPLRDALRALGVDEDIGAHDLRRARTLFAGAIETPGGLKIQTIHSFCAGILRRFPLEAGVSPAFRELDERGAADLRTQALETVAASHPQVTEAFFAHLGGSDLDKMLAAIAAQRDGFATPATETDLGALFGVPAGLMPDALMADLLGRDSAEILRDLIEALRTGSTNDLKAADRLATLPLAAPALPDLATHEHLFLTGA